jgi:hypothetical protein
MLRQGTYTLLSLAPALALSLSLATSSQASIVVLDSLATNVERVLAAGVDEAPAAAEDMDPGQAVPDPQSPPRNPINLTARKGLAPTGSSSSSSSAPSVGSGSLSLCAVASDPASVFEAEHSAWLATATAICIPNVIQYRLFRPPRVA